MSPSFPTILVLFGATGDLVARKIAPALWNLWRGRNLPERFAVIGFSRRDMDHASFREHIGAIIRERPDAEPRPEDCKKFLSLFTFVRGEFDKKSDYAALARTLAAQDDAWGICTNKLFYLAVPPNFYEGIFKRLSSSRLTDPCSPEEGWTRVIVEKPFGKDLATAQNLDRLLATLFREVQIYRIDHYLAKEMLQQIISFRFSNSIFQEAWSNAFIERIDIRLWERLGVEGRGTFYDGVGALRDVGQNHLLQMLALVAMEHPIRPDAESIRFNRAEVLKTLKVLAPEDTRRATHRAQYRGYRAVRGVEPDSETETYFRVRAELGSERWRGVTIIMESGKRMAEQKKEIAVTFRHPSPCLCPAGQEHHKNRIIFSLEPTEGIQIQFWSKKPGLDFAMEERTLDFMLRAERKFQYVEEYEKLMLDCIAGDQTLFVSTEEVEAMWRFTDPIARAWRKNLVPLEFYDPDTDAAPAAADARGESSALKETLKKEIAMIGLGKMGANLCRRLLRKGWRAVGYDPAEIPADLEGGQFVPAESLADAVKKLSPPRLVWIMVPAGKAIDEILFGRTGIARMLRRGDLVIDGSNSFYKDSIARHKKLRARGVGFLDVGVSGGPEGALHGPSLMIGGEKKLFEKIEPLFAELAAHRGYRFFAGAGAGHFVKMIHNGIEYGMMQSLAEGFTILKNAEYRLNLAAVADVYNHGSVIESRLTGWLKKGLEIHGENLDGVSGSVAHTGEGEWTVQTARKLGIAARVIKDALEFRKQSANHPSWTGKALSALREQFGGHRVAAKSEEKKDG